MAREMTHPEILFAEKWGYDFHRLNEPPVHICENCGDEIYEGDDFYDIGDIVCLDCIDAAKRTAWAA